MPGRAVGKSVAQGSVREVSSVDESITGRYLAGKVQIPVPSQPRRTSKTRSIILEGASINNLKQVSVRIPLGGARLRDRL